jgi:predicted metal-binding membrane protein
MEWTSLARPAEGEPSSRRDLWVLTGLLALITLCAWAYLLHEAHAMDRTGVCACLGLQMSGPDLRPWSITALVPLFIMWAEMMVAMMLPSATPMILLFARIGRQRSRANSSFTRVAHFVGGYILVWTAFSAVAAVAQWIFHGAALLSHTMSASSGWLGAPLLIGAGLYQFSPWKDVCLRRCSSPLQFVLAEWREGTRGAWIMGIRHGAFCVGCCALLMALLFVVGVMNVLWIAVLTSIALVEKIAPRQWLLPRVAGIILIGWALWVACGATSGH